MEKDYIYEICNMPEGEDEGEGEGESTSSVIVSQMIGLSDQFKQLKRDLKLASKKSRYLSKGVYALVGSAGIGKTTLAKKIYRDPEIMRCFECRAWVPVGRKSQLGQLSQAILAQFNETSQTLELEGKSCLIVLDDAWQTELLDSLLSFLPDLEYGTIQILVTARDRSVTARITECIFSNEYMVVRFLNEKESKDLLCEKVFGDKQLCPPQLDKAVAKIAKKCEGLPLMILAVAHHLSQAQCIDPEYWNDVAEDRNQVFTDAYNEISKVLFPSYNYLPQYLKMIFLYMGVFSPDYNFQPSKIMDMLAAEGWFLDTNSKQESIWECLNELCKYKNLVLFNEKSISWYERMIDGANNLKSCRLHSSWRHVCRGEAQKNKFYHVLNKLDDGSEEGVEGQRCLPLGNNILFGIQEFCNSVRLNCASYTRSLLFFGPYHQYPIPIDVGFRLLRELDALKQRFYSFPPQILTLVQLKYLALTCNEEVPPTISKLFNLQVLIIHPHVRIRHCRAPSYVPTQIWDMQALEHIEILGKTFLAPKHFATLGRLTTLVGVNANIGTILELSRRIPNIRKLGVQIELKPCGDDDDIIGFFGCISALESLEILKCSIINPVVKYTTSFPTTPSSLKLPRGLRKLHLSGMGFPWEYMDVIASLPFLRVLKLRSYAFRGSKWETQGEGFSKLEFLLIEDTDLMHLNLKSGSFLDLSYLSMKHCYKLKEINWPSNLRHRKIEFVDCTLSDLTCAKRLQVSPYTRIDVTVFSSFDKKPITTKLHRYGRP